jgi:hypothetical protein
MYFRRIHIFGNFKLEKGNLEIGKNNGTVAGQFSTGVLLAAS